MSDICFVVAPQNKDGILDRIAHEIGSAFEEVVYHYDTSHLPKSERYFLTHYSMLPPVLEQINPGITPITCFFTHDKGPGLGGGLINFVEAMNLCHSLVAESQEGLSLLSSLGVNDNILHFVPESGDNIAFQPHARTPEGHVLVCSTNYSDGRKNPLLIEAVMKLSKRKFKFLGRYWDNEGLCDVSYSKYPEEFKDCSVYLSCSKLEGGGPNSLIEAMHANLVPVVSDTGNAREYIIDSYNGFIFGLDAKAEEIVELIEQAFELNPQDRIPYNDVWQTVRDYTWENYASQMKQIITGVNAYEGLMTNIPEEL